MSPPGPEMREELRLKPWLSGRAHLIMSVDPRVTAANAEQTQGYLGIDDEIQLDPISEA